jgi:hypothetical protein
MRIKWNGHTARTGEIRNAYILVGSPKMKRLLGGNMGIDERIILK